MKYMTDKEEKRKTNWVKKNTKKWKIYTSPDVTPEQVQQTQTNQRKETNQQNQETNQQKTSKYKPNTPPVIMSQVASYDNVLQIMEENQLQYQAM